MHMTRTPDHTIDPLFLTRWSPRAYDASAMPESDLRCILEAGRWAPSAHNLQPWRFLFARRDHAHWPGFVSVLDPFNRQWAKDASALVFLLSDTLISGDADQPAAAARYNSFDAGAAWAQIALQAAAMGYAAHAMAGLEFGRARHLLDVPQRFRLEIGIAIGRRSDPAHLPEALRARETPSGRMPLDRIAFPGPFPRHKATFAAE
ncbi:MAG: nitroreductase family protein [Pseudomonadota bacterium]